MDLDELFDMIKTNVERMGTIVNFKEHKEAEWIQYMLEKQASMQKQQEDSLLKEDAQRESLQKQLLEKQENVIKDRLNRLK
mmetsp:Transcript_13926/g.30172  ORF Transcript_13926/g.30172 Transcript_13926/m.30172 type:complete len:81 (+) Transcript_13926:2102-2344(+)